MNKSDTDELLELAALGCGIAALLALLRPRAAPTAPPGAAGPEAAAPGPLGELELAMRLAARGTGPPGPTEPLGPLASAGMQEALSYDPIQVTFDITTGENIVVPGAFGYRTAIYEFSLWNPAVEQDIAIKNGSTTLKPLPNFPVQAGYVLALNKDPHWKLDYNQPFIISLSAGRATGFLKYRPLEY